MMSKNVEFFHHHLRISLETMTKMMRLLEMDPYHTDHASILILLGAIYMKTKYKMALKCCFLAQNITANLDQKVPRNLDFILAINVITSIVLLKIGKPKEAHDFILIAEMAIEGIIQAVYGKSLIKKDELNDDSKDIGEQIDSSNPTPVKGKKVEFQLASSPQSNEIEEQDE